ncbi:hypothetical protein TUBRATIS_28240 [Tubulinosema ratisbonensis]|uniref:Uncharacterized protein n=1 Tax=Tubulinosema ratisbonensis TaxID=291195 RepID=A0A437AI45_9MICR|nr:hypothetical protein TUBRATIS_28240 [Tubulinosema ratisbonensis]
MLHYSLTVLSAYYNIDPNYIIQIQPDSLLNYVLPSNTINIFAQNVIINPYQVVYVPCAIVEPKIVDANGVSGSNDECNLSVSIPHQNDAESERLYTSTDYYTEKSINYVAQFDQTLQNYNLDGFHQGECPMYQPILEKTENFTSINETQQIEAASIEVINFQKNSYLSNELVGHTETIQEESFICNNPTMTACKAEDNYYSICNQEKGDISVGNISESTHQDIKNESFRGQQYKKSINENNKHLMVEEFNKDNKFDHKQENINKNNMISKTFVNSPGEIICTEPIVNNVFKQDQEYEKHTQDISYANCGDSIKSKEINNSETEPKDFFTNTTGKETSEQARSQYLFNSNINKPSRHNRSPSNNHNQKLHIISSKIVQPSYQKLNKKTSTKTLKTPSLLSFV